MTINVSLTCDPQKVKMGILAQIVCFTAHGNALSHEASALDNLDTLGEDDKMHAVIEKDGDIIGYTCLTRKRIKGIDVVLGSKTCVLPAYRGSRDKISLVLAKGILNEVAKSGADVFAGFPFRSISKVWKRAGMQVSSDPVIYLPKDEVALHWATLDCGKKVAAHHLSFRDCTDLYNEFEYMV